MMPSAYPDACGILLFVAEERGNVAAHLAHLRFPPVPQQLHPRRRHPRLRLAARATRIQFIPNPIAPNEEREGGNRNGKKRTAQRGGRRVVPYHLEALKVRRSSTAATAAPASRLSTRAGDFDSDVAIIIAAIALRSWGSDSPPRWVGVRCRWRGCEPWGSGE